MSTFSNESIIPTTSRQVTLLVRSLTQSISDEAALRLVAGKTEKPFGVDPVRLLGAGLGNSRRYRIGLLPVDLFRANEADQRFDGTVDICRAVEYASRSPETMPPVIALQCRRSVLLGINDGGHRLTAARLNGSGWINTLVALHPDHALERAA